MEINKIKHLADELRVVPQDKQKVEQTADKGKGEQPFAPTKADKFKRSDEVSLAKDLISECTEIRREKINEVRARIREGYYNQEEVIKEAIENLLTFLEI